ncbi:hypothetical protein LCGC14_0954350 [marine sediment metagenome]|uniref:Uncharacterized protein n=1 Tax=marine sediment metagenome TaxID=412755 RepID=A0A0F9NG98_9ZZZZ
MTLILSPDAAQRAAYATRYIERQMRNVHTRRARWFRQPGHQRREVMFELYDAMAPDDSFRQAYPRLWDNTNSEWVTDYTAATFPVLDVLSRFRGRGQGDLVSPDDWGSRGLALFRHGRLEVEYLQPHATWITCKVNDSAYTAGPITVDAVVVTQPVLTALLMAAVTEIHNIHQWDPVDDNATVQASWNDKIDPPDYPGWDGVQIDCAASTT